ncbi:ovarian cancer-associated gene 2 protein homolog [Sinocyclocheilus rhinocerous]|uniref:Esterase OVCA2 n=1 Tax=Sinocyclocheilus rhinocerous TaxID=307959 RepID=A0A673FR47_9TELE|nr:PREDICTED: ovarian cancer-associated gene 2 protein homolog [Sinocyclocheilus rhinocerous]
MCKAAVPLRILCIHGYRQNGSSFREKTGALRKILKKQVELVYISAPHHVPAIQNQANREPEKTASGGDEDQRGWWFSDVQARSFNAQQECESSLGLEESVETVKTAVKDLGPFDGILGFSQGAALVAMLCALQEQKLQPAFNFRFAILVAGFRSVCSQHRRVYEVPAITIPSLHVFGQEDRVIPEEMSRDLLPAFDGAQILIHPDGHFVPAASSHRQTYQDFLKKFQ